jgi:hypothetical protein
LGRRKVQECGDVAVTGGRLSQIELVEDFADVGLDRAGLRKRRLDAG